ncbi:MAG: response regulator [Deltaproteobacteria bacterium]|nr:response regulator [Nannocystaceae bacterium]
MQGVAYEPVSAGRLLIVDDDAAVRRVLARLLLAEGYEVVQAGDGEQALAALWSDGTIDTVVLDMRMPGMSGLDVCRKLRSDPRTEHTPVVFVTGMDDRAFRREALQAGATDFLGKPFDEVELLARLRNSVRLKLYFDSLSRERTDLRTVVQRNTQDLEAATARLQRLQLELAVARHETIERLARAAEYRDDETAAHLHRMSHYCHILGQRAGLDDYTCEMLRIASPMHDVGKIGIPDHILLKPGRLSTDEFQIMKQHAEIGFRILSGSDSELVRYAASIAHTHHEQWAGTGYPRGLVGEDIPIEGRVAAIADVFDALTSARPYKRAWTIDAAVDHLRGGAGGHFDPRLVDLFLDSMDEVLAVRERFADRSS